jgi:hypothetical protein
MLYVQIAVIQLKEPIEVDDCMINPTCSAGAPTGCYASSHVKPPEVEASSSSSPSSSSSKCPEHSDEGLDPRTVAEICGKRPPRLACGAQLTSNLCGRFASSSRTD